MHTDDDSTASYNKHLSERHSSALDVTDTLSYLEELDLDQTKKQLMLLVTNLEAYKGSEVRISDDRLERLTGVKAITIKRHVHHLEQLGLLIVLERRRREYALKLTYKVPADLGSSKAEQSNENGPEHHVLKEPGSGTEADDASRPVEQPSPPSPVPDAKTEITRPLEEDQEEQHERILPSGSKNHLTLAPIKPPEVQNLPFFPGVTSHPTLLLALLCLALVILGLHQGSQPQYLFALGHGGLAGVGASALTARRRKEALALVTARTGWGAILATALVLLLRSV